MLQVYFFRFHFTSAHQYSDCYFNEYPVKQTALWSLLRKQNVLHLPVFSILFFFNYDFSEISGSSEQNKYFTDHHNCIWGIHFLSYADDVLVLIQNVSFSFKFLSFSFQMLFQFCPRLYDLYVIRLICLMQKRQLI